MQSPQTSETFNPEKESLYSRFTRHFNPLVIIFFSSSCFAMYKMVKASRQNNALEFQKYQRLRIITSGGVIMSLLGRFLVT